MKYGGITFNTNFSKGDCCSNIIESASRAMELQGRELAMYEKEGIDKLLTINLRKIYLLDVKKTEDLYEIGYKQAKEQIKAALY